MNRVIDYSFVIIIVFAAAMLAGCASWSDAEKIQRQLTLSPAQKLDYDRVFFNEIWSWNQTTWRYGDPSGAKRQREFEAMAANGYLPAHVALQMFNFANGTKAPDASAFELLRAAAEAGDISSACALIPIWAWNTIPGYTRSFEWAVPYVQQGASTHFACQEQLALLYRNKTLSPPSPKTERELLTRSAAQGYVHAFVVLETTLRTDDRRWYVDLDRGLCWAVASKLYSPFASIDLDYYRLVSKGANPQLGLTQAERDEAGRLADKWEGRMKSAQVIMDIVNDCLLLEEKAQ